MGPQLSDTVRPYSEAPRGDERAAGVVATSLGAGDVFEVRVFEEPNLSGAFRVGSDGQIDYPLCGQLKVLGMSAAEAAAQIKACLRDGFMRDPQVSIFITEQNSKKIYVFGEVENPGTFPFLEGMSVVEAVTRAGGFTPSAARNSVVVTRVVDGVETKVQVPVEDIGIGKAPNFELAPGDIVYVPQSFFG